jgi:hypothetical protein
MFRPNMLSQVSLKHVVVLVNDQVDALFLNVFTSRLYMFRVQVLIIRRANFINTSSDITPNRVCYTR